MVDENETPVSQARIAVAAGEVSRATSGPTGLFSVPLAGPGDYLVNVQREGFYELRDHPVHVDALNEVTLVLTPIREVFQSVNVNETPSRVDTGQTALERTLTGTEVNDVPYPSSHSLRNSMKLIPGVVQEQNGALHFEGARESQMLYTLNGFNIAPRLEPMSFTIPRRTSSPGSTRTTGFTLATRGRASVSPGPSGAGAPGSRIISTPSTTRHLSNRRLDKISTPAGAAAIFCTRR